jgi:tRNA(Ile)-lysidine synthase
VTYKYKYIHLRDRFLSFIKEHQLIQQGENILLAVSGGVDSVAMSHLFYEAKLNFTIAHCNFCLRGKDSDADEVFVEALAQQYGVNFYTKHFDTQAYAQYHQISIQMAARALRYNWFNELCKTYQLDKLATAHHATDAVETVLFNLTKGTGIAGLHGILPKQGNLIRPLLFCSKEDLLQYAKLHQLSWREDISNTKDEYARNLIRNKVLPTLKLVNPKLEATTLTTTERINQVELFFNEQLVNLRDDILYEKDNIYHLNLEKIKNKPWAAVVLWELLKPFGFNFLQIKDLLHPSVQSGKSIYSDAYQVYVDRNMWMVSNRNPSLIPTAHTITSEIRNITLPTYKLQIQIITKESYQIVADNQVAGIDLAKLKFPLFIRKWQVGDSFHPLGMQKRKKLSDFLIDLKVPILHKQKVFVLTSENEIVWVIGYRLDDRFKISESTEQIYEITLLLPNA